MGTHRHQGTLKTWKSDRGFGFIKSADGGQDVFLHISAVRRAVREPKMGDTILYTPSLQSDGRIRATNASIQGVALQPTSPRSPSRKSQPPHRSRKARKRQPSLGPLGAVGGAIAGVVLLVFVFAPTYKTATTGDITEVSSKVAAQVNPNCKIKGNISWNS